MSRKCSTCRYFDGCSCEAGVENTNGGCDYHYQTLAKMRREQTIPPREERNCWYTKNGNHLVYYCSECNSPSIRKTRYCPECGSRKEDIC